MIASMPSHSMPESQHSRVVLDLVGGARLSAPDLAGALLDAFHDMDLAPDEYALGEPPGPDYDRDLVLGMITGGKYDAVRVYRRRAPEYSASFHPLRRPRISVTFEAAPHTSFARLVRLGDALAAVQQPHVGWLLELSGIEPPCEDEASLARHIIDESCDGSLALYDEHGPGGLGLVTWLGAPMVERLGRPLLESAPVDVVETRGGGLRLQLPDVALGSPPEVLVAAWERAMIPLATAGVFARPQIDEGYVDFVRGDRFDLDPYCE